MRITVTTGRELTCPQVVTGTTVTLAASPNEGREPASLPQPGRGGAYGCPSALGGAVPRRSSTATPTPSTDVTTDGTIA